MIDKPVQVLVVDAGQIIDPTALAALVAAIRDLAIGFRPILVLDVGAEEIAPRARLSDALAASSSWMSNKIDQIPQLPLGRRLVRALVIGQLDAISLSGADAGLLRGDDGVLHVNRETLLRLLDLGFVPVLSPLVLDANGASHVADARGVAIQVALAVAARKLVFVSDVPGVWIAGRIIRALTLSQIAGLIADGFIAGNTLETVQWAGEAVKAGLHQAVITDPAGLAEDRGTAILNG